MSDPVAIYSLTGKMVVSRAEGRHLGTVTRAYLDADQARLTNIVLRGSRFADERYVSADDLETAGEDVVLLRSAVGANPLPGDGVSGRDLNDLRGLWVTTAEGRHLGAVADVGVARDDWRVCELRLANGQRLPCKADDLRIGRDEILVPPGYAERLVDAPNGRLTNLLAPIIDLQPLEDLRASVRYAFRRARQAANSRAATRRRRAETSAARPGE